MRTRHVAEDVMLSLAGAEPSCADKPADTLHHSYTTREDRDGLVTVINGQAETAFEQGVHLFAQVRPSWTGVHPWRMNFDRR